MTPAKGVHLLHTAPTPVPTGFVNHMEAMKKNNRFIPQFYNPEAAWPSGQGTGLEIWDPEFKSRSDQ